MLFLVSNIVIVYMYTLIITIPYALYKAFEFVLFEFSENWRLEPRGIRFAYMPVYKRWTLRGLGARGFGHFPPLDESSE